MTKLNRILPLLLCILPFLSSAQDKTVTYVADPGNQYEAKTINATHLSARIKVDPWKRLVTGDALFTFVPLLPDPDTIRFNATDMKVSSVALDAKPVDFSMRGDELLIIPGTGLTGTSEHKLDIRYVASNSRYLYHTGWDDPAGLMRKEVWAHRPFSWLPYLTARLTVDLHVTFDSRFKVFSNGIRDSVTVSHDGTSTWHYRMPDSHPFFSTALVIGDYEWKSSRTETGTPLEFWYYPDQADRVETTYKHTEQMFSFFEKELGVPYPWALYREAPVADYLYGAMETTTSTIFGDYMVVNSRAWWMRNYVNVNAHELNHQWFGNYISHIPGSGVWLTESFATYYAKLFEKNHYGEDFYRNERNNEMLKTFEIAAQNSYPLGSSMGGTQRWYQKGSLVLDMLRYVMGDEAFRKGITHYLQKFRYTDAEPRDLERALWEATGMPMDWFFDEWIDRGGEPEYAVKWSASQDEGGNPGTLVTVEQVQKTDALTPLFRMPVLIRAYAGDGTFSDKKVWIEKQHEEVFIPNPGNKKTAFVLFDPGREVLRKLSFPRNFEELAAQLRMAPGMIDRYDALIALRENNDTRKTALLLESWKKETFHLTRSEIISQLAKESSEQVLSLLGEAIHDSDAMVRRAVVNHVTKVPAVLKKDYQILLKDMDYFIVEKSLENLCVSFPKDAKRYLAATASEEGWRGKNIRVKWLELSVSQGNRKYLDELKNYSSVSYEFETRKNALEALQRLDYMDSAVALNLLRACAYWNFKLSDAARKILGEYKKNTAKWALIRAAYTGGDWSGDEKKELSKLME